MTFKAQVETAFRFLQDDFGFRRVVDGDTYVRYESDRVSVNVYHGRSSRELKFEIGRLASPASQYYPSELVALYGANDETFFQASSPDRVAQYVPRLADLLRRYGTKLLAGDLNEFAELQGVRERISTAVTQGYFLADKREEAELAWRSRDYRGLIEALNAIGPDMSPSEQWKLRYALQKVGTT